MLYEAYVASEVAKFETQRVERKAAENWRFRHIKSKESQVLTDIFTSVLQLSLLGRALCAHNISPVGDLYQLRRTWPLWQA